MTYTGIMLFIAPTGRIAHWVEWSMLGMTKEQFGAVHTTFMVLFIIATIMHVYYNFKPMMSYLKNKSKELVLFTKEMVVASLITVLFFVGTIYEIPPFSKFLQMGEKITNNWEKKYGNPPFSHAELVNLKVFAKKLEYNLEDVEKILKDNSINYTLSQSLGAIAKTNQIAPSDIYNILKAKLEKDNKKTKKVSGLGRKDIKTVAESLGMSTENLISKLKELGINANKDDKFKEVTERYGKSPSDIIKALGFEHD
jgi:NACalpha-BTF3-like transcription factor